MNGSSRQQKRGGNTSEAELDEEDLANAPASEPKVGVVGERDGGYRTYGGH